jgi:hypothetical protein
MNNNTQRTEQEVIEQQVELLLNTASQHVEYLDPVSFGIGARMVLEQTAQLQIELASLRQELAYHCEEQ